MTTLLHPRLTLLLMLFLCSSVTSVLGQRSVRDLERYMTTVKQTPHQPLPESILTDIANGDPLLTTLTPYFADTADIVRTKAYYIAKRIGQRSTSQSVRQRVVHHLILAIRDRNSGISGLVTEGLTGFDKDNFDRIDRDTLGRYLQPGVAHLDEILKLAGYLELRDQQNRIRAIITSNVSPKYKWAARLALARMGDNEALAYIQGKLSKAVINDDLIYDVVPDLVYTRQKPIFKFLEGIINSDRADCSSADPDSNKKTICGYRVVELVAPAIENFPVSVDETGNLNNDDYASALTAVRTWLQQNPDYRIKNNSY
jgi:hypothetical protein